LKRNIDSTKEKLDKKEEERKLEARVKNQEELFDDEDGPNDEIIDEEELMLLREQKDLKREYRDKYSQLKSLKSEM
jgi:hypothetical protein|tara:strand:+ start:271 stop:498 length:228 start_codon:yes stop_codon:yes gene_type:complete